MFPSTAKENRPSSASSSSMPSVVPDNNNNINEDENGAKKTCKEIRDETIRLIQAYLDEPGDSMNKVRRATLKKLLGNRNVEDVTDESFLQLKIFLDEHQSKADTVKTKFNLQGANWREAKDNLKAIKKTCEKESKKLQQLLVESNDESIVRALGATLTERQKKFQEEHASLNNRIETLNNNITSLKEELSTHRIPKSCIKLYLPANAKHHTEILSKAVCSVIIDKLPDTQSALNLALSSKFFKGTCQDKLNFLWQENERRTHFGSLVGFLPHWHIRQKDPELSKQLIEEKVEKAEAILQTRPKGLACLLYKTGPLTQQGLPPLYLAATRANKVMWEMLLRHLPEKNYELHSEIAHLQWAVTNVELDNVRDLISINPDLLITQSPLTRWDCTPLFIAARQQNLETHKILMDHSSKDIPKSVKQASECLYFVSGGQQAPAKELAEKNPDLIIQAGIDGHSPLQMAASLGDMHMFRMLLSHLKDDDKQTAILQLEEVDKNSWLFNPKPFLAAYQTYVNNFDKWYESKNWSALRAAWQKIGWELRLAPQHIVAEFCQDHPLDPTPKFKKQTLKRRCVVYNYKNRNNEDLFPLISDSGLGFDFHLSRGYRRAQGLQVGHLGWWWPGDEARSDFLAMKALFKVRRDEYEEIKQVLKDPERELQDYLQPSSGCCIC